MLILAPAGGAGSGACPGYLNSIMAICQTVDLPTQTLWSGSKLPVWLSEPAELALAASLPSHPSRQVSVPTGTGTAPQPEGSGRRMTSGRRNVASAAAATSRAETPEVKVRQVYLYLAWMSKPKGIVRMKKEQAGSLNTEEP